MTNLNTIVEVPLWAVALAAATGRQVAVMDP